MAAECKAGEHLNSDTLFCTKCDYGTYQPRIWQKQCEKCPATTWTKLKGATQKTDCERKLTLDNLFHVD